MHLSFLPFFLKANKKAQRRRRQSLLERTRLALVYVASGLDASYSWQKAGGKGVFKSWQTEPQDPPDVRTWLKMIEELYGMGTPIEEILTSFVQYLENHIDQELEQHVESLPRRSQVVFLFFYAPPAFFVLLYPWISEMGF